MYSLITFTPILNTVVSVVWFGNLCCCPQRKSFTYYGFGFCAFGDIRRGKREKTLYYNKNDNNHPFRFAFVNWIALQWMCLVISNFMRILCILPTFFSWIIFYFFLFLMLSVILSFGSMKHVISEMPNAVRCHLFRFCFCVCVFNRKLNQLQLFGVRPLFIESANMLFFPFLYFCLRYIHLLRMFLLALSLSNSFMFFCIQYI